VTDSASRDVRGAAAAVEQALLNWIDSHEERLLATLATLIRFRTPNPPGGNEAAAQDWVESRLRELGLEVDRWDVLPGRPDVVGRLRGEHGHPTVVLNGHIDVCEERLLDRWATDPYDAVVEGRDVIGRGSTDMKSSLAAYLVTIEALRACGVRLVGDVVVQSVMGEEAGEPGTRDAVARGHVGDFAIVGEQSRARDILASIGLLNCRITVESPYTLHLVARKHTINAGGGLEGANCIEKMALRIIPALIDLERQWAVFKTHPLVPPGFCNINVFRIDGGANTFFLPDRCVAYITVTYLPHERPDEIRAEVEKHVRRAADVDEWLRKHPPSVEWNPAEHPIEFAAADFDPDSRPVRLLADSIADVSNREPAVGARAAINDAGWFHRAGIPAVVYGPGDVEFVHRVDERVHLDDVVAYCKVLALFLKRYCGSAAVE
jgi:formylaminopyrimidine deformylase